MAFSLTRPPSPSGELHNAPNDEDSVASALHAALSSFASGSSAHSHPTDHDMSKDKDKERSGIDIIMESSCITLKGAGVDVEPALLSGHVVLNLTESTSIKEITLQFRGKVRLPAPLNEQRALNYSPQVYNICTHDWSFLEGEKRHSHTLKAGRHLFPFQLQLGGTLPSSIATAAHGGVVVSYKLRAVAVRPGLAHNMQTVIPIFLTRSFASEALEYQQTLEIENSWPEKLMYSIMIPHKAWAIGDTLTALVKFSPLAKGVQVLRVITQINETTKVHYRGSAQEHTRTVTTVEHDISQGRAVLRLERRHSLPVPITHGTSLTSPPGGLSSEGHTPSSGSLAGQLDALSFSRPSRSGSSSSLDSNALSSAPLPSSSTEPSESLDAGELQMSEADVVTQLSLTLPRSATPSHSLEPIIITHRIRWSILMSNLDGHTSELRCSLPLYILDRCLLEEARANTAATRRLMLGGPETPLDEEHDVELPSYPAHIRDRVPNMSLPEAATVRVTNPWAAHINEGPSVPSASASPRPTIPHLPPVPQSETSTPLEWINSELLLSMSRDASPQHATRPNSPSHSDGGSHPTSRAGSRLVSRRGSRAPSPERHLAMTSISGTSATPNSTSSDTYAHSSQASRSLPGIFTIAMKPATHGWLPSRSSSYTNLAGPMSPAAVPPTTGHQVYSPVPIHSPRPLVPVTPPTEVVASTTESVMWHRALTEVPDYGSSASGIIGGVPPLTTMHGLPSYEEAERCSGHEPREAVSPH
ncbi:hypothetical protein ID866_1401 [Astraeus odoratus]|nr:hypothetical protein ID866_1401 [Astraeus odoratus]